MRKRKNTGRLLSILLCLVMVLGTLPTTALADEPQLEGDPIPESISFSVIVMKKDDNGSPLKGAHFELIPMPGTNGEGKFAYSDENGIATFDTNITPGTYTLAETEAPFGYVAAADRYTVEVYGTPDAEGNVLSVKPIIPNSVWNIVATPHKNGATIATFFNKPVEKVEISLSIEKTVVQGGNVAPGSETFTFELLMGDGEDQDTTTPLYRLLDTAEISTNGAGTTEHTLKFKIPEDLNSQDGFGRNDIYLRERAGSAAGWTYDDALYRVSYMMNNDDSHSYIFHGVDPTTGNYLEKAPFTNIYNGTSYKLPFTKTVKLGGNTAPGRETFELEIFNVGNSNLTNYGNLYTADVTTNGVGDYDGKLVISGPADQVRELVCEGFYVREKNAGTANWSYSDEVWFVSREQVPSVPGDGTVILPGGFPGNITPTDPEREYTFKFYPATAEVSDNGIFYDYNREDQREKMTFTNTYTYHTSVIPTGAAITANKTDAQGKALAGATFVLEDSRGREAYQATSNTSGTVRFTDVSSGTYTLLEKKAPEGYVLSNETYTLTVSGSRVTMNDKAYSPVTFVNRKAAELNRTDHFIFLVGYTDGTFGPERDMTRAEVTTMFARLLTERIEADKTDSNTFSDVPKGYWAANYIGYMRQFGIITGYSDGSFRPDAPVTRAEFAAIASRFEKLTQGSKSFTDVPDTYWAARYINFAATRGWVTGYSDGTFKPENPITRAEVAAVTCRLLERSADQSYIRSHLKELRTFSDVTESHWAYWYAMEAANGHDYTKSGGSENWSRTYR
ncbi:S-layer homology domain-containing protein [Oscillibacter sp. MSJ-2]|uniref:S-layer homology domain-containing protein n=1 Tax=Dysosmobacter acutus TaxID=2841504 RepID=A0ABS6FD08_9FIRM|nr:S-layer homology domain-containing protein [Dysosmobacter acutus]MBU5628157.1 S-layer homology domain-containing protein [Dysosmobacter acutus]